jgi:glycosyltransferase involved in cell wall biosynthesis
MKLLSIIVPIYNVEPYVERCLLSLEDQDIPKNDYEIICINDGSPDESREIVLRIQQEFDNIILLDQENQGVARARNNGINKACGKYIIFIDPDDYVDSNCFERILKRAAITEAQVSFLGFTILNENESVRNIVYNEQYIGQIFQGTEAYFLTRCDGCADPDRIYAVLLETGFLKGNNLLFVPDVPYLEDGELISRILCLAERCIFDGHSFYQRTTRPGSATNSMLFYSEKANKGFLLAASNLKRFQKEQRLNKFQKDFLNQPVCKFVILVVTSASLPFSFQKIGETKRKLRENGLIRVNLETVDSEYKKLGFFYNRSVYFLLAYQFIISKTRLLRLKINLIREKL